MKSILMTALAMSAAIPALAAEGVAAGDAVTIYTTAQGASQQMVRSQSAPLRPGHALTEAENSVFVEPGRKFQSFLGIGGAITDATAETFAKLDDALLKLGEDKVDDALAKLGDYDATLDALHAAPKPKVGEADYVALDSGIADAVACLAPLAGS